MDIFVANSGFHHLAYQIFGYLSFQDLNNVSLVSKQFHIFMSQPEIWIRTLNKIQIIQEPDEADEGKKLSKFRRWPSNFTLTLQERITLERIEELCKAHGKT